MNRQESHEQVLATIKAHKKSLPRARGAATEQKMEMLSEHYKALKLVSCLAI